MRKWEHPATATRPATSLAEDVRDDKVDLRQVVAFAYTKDVPATSILGEYVDKIVPGAEPIVAAYTRHVNYNADFEARRLASIALARKREGRLDEAQELYELSFQIYTSAAKFEVCYGLAKVLFLRQDWSYACSCYMVATELGYSGVGDLDNSLIHLGHTVLAWSIAESRPYALSDLVDTAVLSPECMEMYFGRYRDSIRGLGPVNDDDFRLESVESVLRRKVSAAVEVKGFLKSLPSNLGHGVTLAIGLYYFHGERKPMSCMTELQVYLAGHLADGPSFGSDAFHKAIARLSADR